MNGRQSSSDKKHNISLRRFLFFPLPLLFRRLSTVFFIDSETKEAILSHFWNVFTFLTRKNSLRKTFLFECVWSGAQQAARKGGNFGAKLTRLCDSWLDVSFFSHVKTIVHSSDWLELICVSKFTTQLFCEYFSVCI